MTSCCGGKTGGWGRVVHWNIHEPGTQCLSGLMRWINRLLAF